MARTLSNLFGLANVPGQILGGVTNVVQDILPYAGLAAPFLGGAGTASLFGKTLPWSELAKYLGGIGLLSQIAQPAGAGQAAAAGRYGQQQLQAVQPLLATAGAAATQYPGLLQMFAQQAQQPVAPYLPSEPRPQAMDIEQAGLWRGMLPLAGAGQAGYGDVMQQMLGRLGGAPLWRPERHAAMAPEAAMQQLGQQAALGAQAYPTLLAQLMQQAGESGLTQAERQAMAQAQEDIAQRTAAAESGLTAGLVGRGLGQSSLLAGSLSNLRAQQLGEETRLRRDLALQAIARQQQRQAAALQAAQLGMAATPQFLTGGLQLGEAQYAPWLQQQQAEAGRLAQALQATQAAAAYGPQAAAGLGDVTQAYRQYALQQAGFGLEAQQLAANVQQARQQQYLQAAGLGLGEYQQALQPYQLQQQYMLAGQQAAQQKQQAMWQNLAQLAQMWGAGSGYGGQATPRASLPSVRQPPRLSAPQQFGVRVPQPPQFPVGTLKVSTPFYGG